MKKRLRKVASICLLVIGSVILAAVFALVGYWFYEVAEKTQKDFLSKLGDLFLQISVVVVLGALAKSLIDWAVSLRAKKADDHEKKSDFLKRLRAAHVAVQYARQLLNAHQSPKTYSEQLRTLMRLRYDLEEISEDLKATSDLFSQLDVIVPGVEGMIEYLKQGSEEYVQFKGDVEADYAAKRDFRDTITTRNMQWLVDFMESGSNYTDNYLPNLLSAKSGMRIDLFGA